MTDPSSPGKHASFDDPRLVELEPRFRRDAAAVLAELAGRGWQPRIASAHRTAEAQAEKVRQGLSHTLSSAHLTGRAADIIDRRHGWQGPASRRDFAFWNDLGAAARRRGLTWGGDWPHFPDVAHIQDDRPEAAATVISSAGDDLPTWFSLGGGCSVAYQLRRRHLRLRPTPFDWIRTPFSALSELLASDFAGFLAEDGAMQLDEGPPRVLRERRLGIVFPHDCDRYMRGGVAALRRHFAPGVAAMRHALEYRSHVVLVRRRLGWADAEALREVLRLRYPRLDVTLVGVHDDPGAPRTVERRDDCLQISTPRTITAWRGCDDAWDWALDRVMDMLLRWKLPQTLPRALLGRDWLQAQSTLAHMQVRHARTLEDIPPVLVRALVAGEDHRFHRHHGIDPIAVGRAVIGLITGRPLGGGSTIEQQLYRVLTNRRERTIGRKLRELLGAYFLSGIYDKRTLASRYLTAAYFGAAMNGLEQAARALAYSLPDLSEEEAAALVARLKYPEPRVAGPRRRAQIHRRTRWILGRMEQSGAKHDDP